MENTLGQYIRAFMKGENEAFSRIYERFRKPIRRYVSLRISDDQVAEEVTQEIFIKLFRFRESYDGEKTFSTWLWTIARNTVFDVLRATKVTPEELDPDELPCERKSAESLLEARDLRRSLLKMTRPLTRLQRRVLWLRIVHQRSYDEISRQLGLSLSSVKNLAYRAKLTLTESLGGMLPEVAIA